jgi:putative flippase GtrA
MKSVRVNYPILVIAFIVGSSGLVALGSFSPGGHPAVIIAGSIVGIGYAFLVNKWFTSQSKSHRERLNPRLRWPALRKRNIIMTVIIMLWFGLLFGAFNIFPVMTQPALGAISVVGLWLIASYAYNPQVISSGSSLGSESKLDWFAYFFENPDGNEASKVSDKVNEDGSIKSQKLPLEEMQAAWENEQASLDEYRARVATD